MKHLILFASVFSLALSSCIKDDLINDRVDPNLRITRSAQALEVDSSFQFEHSYLNNVGQPEDVAVTWTSSDPSILTIDNNGLAQGITAGVSQVAVSYDNGEGTLTDTTSVLVGDTTISMTFSRSGTVNTTSTYVCTGDFVLSEDGSDIKLEFFNDYQQSTALPGLYVYLSNNPNNVSNALEIGAVSIFSGAHSYTISGAGINDYNYVVYFCKPFNVKVGHGEIQ